MQNGEYMSRRFNYDDSEIGEGGTGYEPATPEELRHNINTPGHAYSDNLAMPQDQGVALDLLALSDRMKMSHTHVKHAAASNSHPTIAVSAPPHFASSDNLKNLPIFDVAEHAAKMHPQFAALMLSRLPKHVTREVLSLLSEPELTPIFSRLLAIDNAAIDVVEFVETKILTQILNADNSVSTYTHGENSFISLIYDLPLTSQKKFIEQAFLRHGDSFLKQLEVQNLKALSALSRQHLQALYQKADIVVLLKAYSGAISGPREMFLDTLSKDAKAQFIKTLNAHNDVSQIDRVEAQCVLINSAQTALSAEHNTKIAEPEPLASFLE